MAWDKENIRHDIADEGVVEAGCEKGVWSPNFGVIAQYEMNRLLPPAGLYFCRRGHDGTTYCQLYLCEIGWDTLSGTLG